MKMRLFYVVVAMGFVLPVSTRLLAQDSNTNTTTKGKTTTTDPNDPFEETLKKAGAGDAWAQCNLGVMYDNGQGVPQDYKEAVKWYTKAAEQGYASAQYNLGVMNAEGRGVPQDYKEAVKWFSKVAKQGNAWAQYNLGAMYANGRGVPQDYKEAVKWYTKAAEQGIDKAQCILGGTYEIGRGVSQDYKEAVKWYAKAAKQGNAMAQFSLGMMYWNGQGVPEDYVEAYKWINIASAQGLELATKGRDMLRKRMSLSQIAEAQQLSKEFKPKTQEQIAADTQNPEKAKIKSSGTGFFITADGYLLTAYHVVKEAASVQVWTGKELSPAKVVRADSANDIALLKIDGVQVNALAVQSSRDVKVGQDVFTLGFPNIQFQGTEAKYTQGNISSLSGMGDDPRLFQISVQVQPGNSGGPLLDTDGQVVGLVVFKLDEIVTAQETGSLPQNVNYALKSSFVLSFLESLPELNSKLLQEKKTGLSRTQVVEKSSKAVVMVLCY
jgi:TPR repeat protein